jgi:acetyl esterase/lipase
MSIENIDPELNIPLQGYRSMALDFSPSGLHRTRALVRELIDAGQLHRPETIIVEDLAVSVPHDGSELTLRIYRPRRSEAPVPILYWMHGGGMVIGSFDMDDALLVDAVERLGLAVASVDYRLAPEHPDPTPVEDCYAGLVWIAEHSAALGVDPNRIAVGGISAGGGLAAGIALLARDRAGPSLRFQLLLAPMLDDRAVSFSSTAYDESTVWNRNDNRSAWTALLGTRVGTDDVSNYAAPGRATELAGLPPTFLDVGEIETFRDESIDYARRLLAAGVSTELHVYSGAFHGFDVLAPESRLARRAWSLRWGALALALGLPNTGLGVTKESSDATRLGT